MVSINNQQGEEIATEFGNSFGVGVARFFCADVTSHESLESAFAKCVEIFGRIDVVVNSAGILGETNWEAQVDVNLKVSWG